MSIGLTVTRLRAVGEPVIFRPLDDARLAYSEVNITAMPLWALRGIRDRHAAVLREYLLRTFNETGSWQDEYWEGNFEETVDLEIADLVENDGSFHALMDKAERDHNGKAVAALDKTRFLCRCVHDREVSELRRQLAGRVA